MNSTETLPAELAAKESAEKFLNTLFQKALEQGYGEIEIRGIKKKKIESLFYLSPEEAAEKAMELDRLGFNAYFGVNPRIDKGGKKEKIHYTTTFHAEIDYGINGHKKKSKYETYDEALQAIKSFKLPPSIIVHSGGGLHCYWILKEPLKVSDYGVEYLESINRALCHALGGDNGTQNLDRILRVPGTFNYKLKDNPRPVTLIDNTGQFYDIDDFKWLIKTNEKCLRTIEIAIECPDDDTDQECFDNMAELSQISTDNLNIPDKIKNLILNGNDGTYPSRSEADMAVIIFLLKNGYENMIQSIFRDHTIGKKYREHNKPEAYLTHSVNKAREFMDLTEEEMINPLFISGAIVKLNKKYRLNITQFQEYMTKKHCLKMYENTFFRFSSKCYEACSHEAINNLCQKELNNYRNLFTQSELSSFIHYAVGDILLESDKFRQDQVNYLTLNNGLYSLTENILLQHSKDIFTMNLLPYDYDPEAKCARFLQYLDEVFLGDTDKISFVQEAVGYALHKGIPMPALFFLVGSGSNGKSVFLDILSSLYGEHNSSSINLSALANEYYLIELFGKMVNISSETPTKKLLNSDLIKAVVAGDTVTGRIPHQAPKRFRPYAKHYLAMNETPHIDDPSYGMMRRLYPIDFPKTFDKDEMDTHLTEKLIIELPGIFIWALEGYKRLKENDFKFKVSKSVEDARENYRNRIDHVRAFANQFIKASDSETDSIKFSDLYSKYQSYCHDEGHLDVKGKKDMKDYLSRIGFIIKNSTVDRNQVYVYRIKWLTNGESD